MATRDEISLELRQQRMTETIKTYETLRAENERLLERCENAEADALRLHGDKMGFYTAALKLICSEQIKNVCGWYPEIEEFRKLCDGAREQT